ncbi:MAG: TIGR00730 family Rossman fold protein [Candidatus Magasanikbacteria bacterium]|nr:TIGR00730 family Rossman fold protein [Candidatus Magasanikbacteria bacterium]
MKEQTIKKIQRQSKKDFSYTLNETGEYREPWRIFRIMSEFVEGYQFLSRFDHVVTVLGSARLKLDNKYYKIARNLGKLLSDDNFTLITGGGPGIMEAANRGASEGKGKSVGLNIQLPFEQRINPYVQESTAFYYFFTRKVMLTAPAQAFVFFPGGFGTMDEFFEVIDMMELKKMSSSPIILVGKEYWTSLIDFLKEQAVAVGSVKPEDMGHWHIVDSEQEAYKIIKENRKEKNEICELSPLNFRCDDNLDWKIFRIMAELVEGFEFLTGLIEDVTVLGTKSIEFEGDYYKAAHDVAGKLSKKGFAIVTGGASGVAEGANKGAMEAGGQSLGIGMEVSDKARLNPYVTKSIIFKFPFTRKLIVTAPSKGFIFFPGGFGTMHQLFEVLTLIQTKKISKVPVLLYDHKFWQPLHSFIKKIFVHQLETVGDEDDEIYQIVDDIDSIVKIIENSRRK